MKLKIINTCVIAFCAVSISNAQFAYAINTNQDLYLVNLATGGKNLIGPTGAGFYESISLHPNGTLYGADSGGNFYSISTVNGASTLIGNTGLGNHEAMDWVGGATWVTDFATQPSLYIVDENTGLPTLWVQSDTQTGAVRTMAFNSAATILYMIGDAGQSSQGLFAMAPSGVTTYVGDLGNFTAAVDMDANDVMWSLDASGNIGTIDLNTGLWTATGNNTGGDFWLDMTMAPVPEPASMIALGAGVAALAARRRKKKA